MMRMLMYRVNFSESTRSKKSIRRPEIMAIVASANSNATTHQNIRGSARWCLENSSIESITYFVTARIASGTSAAANRQPALAVTTPGADCQTMRKTGGMLRSPFIRSGHLDLGCSNSTRSVA